MEQHYLNYPLEEASHKKWVTRQRKWRDLQLRDGDDFHQQGLGNKINLVGWSQIQGHPRETMVQSETRSWVPLTIGKWPKAYCQIFTGVVWIQDPECVSMSPLKFTLQSDWEFVTRLENCSSSNLTAFEQYCQEEWGKISDVKTSETYPRVLTAKHGSCKY